MLYPSISFQSTNEAQYQFILRQTPEWVLLGSRQQASATHHNVSPQQPTLVEVRAKLTELTRNGKSAEVKALLAKYGAASVTQLAPEHFVAVLAEAGGATC